MCALTNTPVLVTPLVIIEAWGSPSQLADKLRTEADAYLFMEELRWGNDPLFSHFDNVGASYIQPGNGVSRKTRTGAMSERRVSRFAGSHLETDSLKSYKGLGRRFLSHQTVDHTCGEYVRGTVSTNMAERYFSQLKRSLDGTHHHVSREHLDRYLAEFDYRYITRKISDTQRMHRLMGKVGGGGG
jgi:hypothetical protein